MRAAICVGALFSENPDQAAQVREPHPGKQSLAADVSDREQGLAAHLEHCQQVTGNVLCREALTGDFEIAASKLPRTAKLALHLRSLGESALQKVALRGQAGDLLSPHCDFPRCFR
jgi:hypothetical protein